jgi:hypothetical protein
MLEESFGLLAATRTISRNKVESAVLHVTRPRVVQTRSTNKQQLRPCEVGKIILSFDKGGSD